MKSRMVSDANDDDANDDDANVDDDDASGDDSRSSIVKCCCDDEMNATNADEVR